jgi:general secretion pathway protein D
MIDEQIHASPRRAGTGIQSVFAEKRTADLVVDGSYEAIAAIKTFISEACARAPSDIEVVPLLHASASKVARAVTRAADPGVRIIAEDTTNSILLQGGAAQRERVRSVIATLDVP